MKKTLGMVLLLALVAQGFGQPGDLPKPPKMPPPGGPMPGMAPLPPGEGPERSARAWLGLNSEEAPESLAAQLKLEPGSGLVVTYVSPGSPAANAGIEKNDLLVKLDEHLLVHPSQMRRLVQARKVGDSLKLVFYRAGQKQETSVTLESSRGSRDPFAGEDWPSFNRDLNQRIQEQMREQMRGHSEQLRRSMQDLGVDRDRLQEEIRRSMEQARKSIEEALRRTSNVHALTGPAAAALRDLTKRELRLEEETRVLDRDRKSRTMVRSDDEGTVVLLANPRMTLIVHDRSGEKLFEGPVETAEERDKIPASIKERVVPLIEQFEKDLDKPPTVLEPAAEPKKQSRSLTPHKDEGLPMPLCRAAMLA